MAKSFRLAAERSVEGETLEPLDFTVEGTEETLYAFPPSEGQLVLLTAAAGARDATRQSAEFMDTFWSLLDEETTDILRSRMLDPGDTFGLTDVMHIIQWLSEEAAARPTESSGGSTLSPRSTGNRSTVRARARASTRSPSPQIDS
jgi:hypothetical protein